MTLFRDAAALDDSAEAAATRFGDVDAETLVKDYWVTECLRILTREFGEHFVFKGGTSLTKAIRCVERFSEDVDMLVTSKPHGVSFDRLMKSMAAAVTVETPLVEVGTVSTRNVKRNVSLRYPTRHNRRYRPEVLLEMGIRGSDVPGHLDLEIQPMIAEVPGASFDPEGYRDLMAFTVAVLHPARTLWEKVVLLHASVAVGTWQRDRDPSRLVRHYGDVEALLGVDTVRAVLSDGETRRLVDASVRELSSVYFDTVPGVPAGGYAMSRAFVPEDDYRRFLDEHFDATVDSLWAAGSRPSLQGVFDAVAQSANLLDPAGP